jgi:hypothetical protein
MNDELGVMDKEILERLGLELRIAYIFTDTMQKIKHISALRKKVIKA